MGRPSLELWIQKFILVKDIGFVGFEERGKGNYFSLQWSVHLSFLYVQFCRFGVEVIGTCYDHFD